MNRLTRLGALCALALGVPALALAQITYQVEGSGKNDAFPKQNPQGPGGVAYQVNYPYEGQCVADPANAALFPDLPLCTAVQGTSFDCTSKSTAHRTGADWVTCGTVNAFKELAPLNADSTLQANPTPKFVWEFLNPPDYAPDTTTYVGADYYEMQVHEAWGFQTAAALGIFPDPTIGSCSVTTTQTCSTVAIAAGLQSCPATETCVQVFPGAPPVPAGMQWTGITCNIPGGCTCPPDSVGTVFATQYCSANGKIPPGYPLYTPIWGAGSVKNGVALSAQLGAGPASPWSNNDFLATWPSISIRAKKGTPLVVKWINEFPNTHVMCPHPDVADWPCAIDRTFMGVKPSMDPAALQGMAIPHDKVNIFGSPQQPDNSWVTHLHGGEIPPSTDGFALKWFGNSETAKIYNTGSKLVTPAFENVSGLVLARPNGNADVYSYPMVQEEALIWWHDHTIGKTHHNVLAGPAGLVPVKEPARHASVSNGQKGNTCPPGEAPPCNADYTWLDPVTEPRVYATALNLAVPLYDQFIVIQDRAFNDDGSINFSNGLGQTMALPPGNVGFVPGQTSVTPGVNPLVHPTWLPEYFGDHAIVNGVAWPKKSTEPGWYRLRFVDGSDSRCYTLGFQISDAPPAPGTLPAYNLPFWVIANDQGYLKKPVRAQYNRFTMCPGERYEVLVNFGFMPGVPFDVVTKQPVAKKVWLVNSAAAPFPFGESPQQGVQPELNVIMGFDVDAKYGPGVKSCNHTVVLNRQAVKLAPTALTWDATLTQTLADPTANLAKSAGGAGLPPAGFYSNICMPIDPAQLVPNDPSYTDIRGAVTATPGQPLAFPQGAIVRQMYLNERLDAAGAPMGMQLNGVPFEYKVTETPKDGTIEYWQFINLTVDSHPMHPHLVRNQIVARQPINVAKYKNAICGSPTCQPGPAPGGEMVPVPDVNAVDPVSGLPLYLGGTPLLVTPASFEGGYKDAVQVWPSWVTTIVADWSARWTGAGAGTHLDPVGTPNAPGSIGCPVDGGPCVQPPWTYEAVTAGPYVWHCHINSHEDSEMMRTSLVVPKL